MPLLPLMVEIPVDSVERYDVFVAVTSLGVGYDVFVALTPLGT